MIAALALSAAAAVPTEVYVAAVGVGHLSSRQVVAGAGAGLGVRLHVSRWDVWAEGEGLVFSVPAAGAVLGGGYGLVEREAWELVVGLEAAAYWGTLVVVSSEQPVPIVGPAVALRAVVRPVVLHLDSYEVSMGELSYGRALEDPLASHAVRLGVLSVGRRF